MILAGSLALAGLAATARGQDLYKSRAEMLQAEAANKQANASIIHALADYSKSQAEVAKIGEEVRLMQANNDLREAEVFYKKRAQYHEYQAAHRPKPASPGQQAARARQLAPERLASYQVEPDGLRWPTLLRFPSYDTSRRQVDRLWQNRTLENSGAGSQSCVLIVAALDQLKAALLENIDRYGSSDYLAARKFLSALALEAQEPIVSVSDMVDKVAGR
jgi:hypothetical protein